MKYWITRWFESKTEEPTRNAPDLRSVNHSKIATDELEQRLISEADAWARQYEQAGPSQTQTRELQPRTQEREFDSGFRMRSRKRQMIPVITLLAVCLVILCGVPSWYKSSLQQTIGQHENRQEDLKQKDIEIQSVIASVHAVDEICGKVLTGIRRREISLRACRVDTIVESSLVNAAEHLKQPGRQYGRSLAWIERRLQLHSPAAMHRTKDTPN